MDIREQYARQLHLLMRAQEENLFHPLIQRGVIYVFLEQFDLAVQILRQALRQDGQGMVAMGSSKEVIMAAYEEYLFIDESLWLAMLRDRQNAVVCTDKASMVRRIFRDYIPVFVQLQVFADERDGQEE